MSSKNKNYLQTQLFPDEDIKLPKHDDIMFWLDKNIENIVDDLEPRNINYLLNDQKGVFKDKIDEAINYLSNNPNEIDKVHYLKKLDILEKDYIRKLPIKIVRKIWEYPVNEVYHGYNGVNKKSIGFIDFLATYTFPVYAVLEGITEYSQGERWQNKKSKFVVKDEVFIGFKKETKKLYFEVKTKIESVGVLLRQINYYRTHINDGKFVVVSESEEFRDILNEQNIWFVKYEPNKYSK